MLMFFFTVAVSQMEVGFSLHLIRQFGWNAQESGYLGAAMGIVMASVQGGAIGPLSRRFGEARAMLGGVLITALGFWLVAQADAISAILASAVCVSFGRGVAQPSLSSLVSLAAPPDRVGLVLGFFQSAGSLGRIVGPPIAGLLFDHLGPHAPFYFGALVLCGTLLAGWRGIKRSLWER
jgi:MFS family permease